MSVVRKWCMARMLPRSTGCVKESAVHQDTSVQTVAAPRESAAFFTRSQRRSHETPLQGEETRPSVLTALSDDLPARILGSRPGAKAKLDGGGKKSGRDRKSTRLNSSHITIS